jgi:hypothetical protein
MHPPRVHVSTRVAGMATLSVLLASLLTAMPVSAALTQDAANKAALDAYVYGFSLVLMDVTREQSTNVAKPTYTIAAPLDQFSNIPEFPPPENHAVVAPNADTLYSVAWIDLSKGPVVFHVPDYKGRYFLMPMLDMWTNVFQSPGTRTGFEKGGNFALVGPGWSGTLPSGLTKIQAPTSTIWIIGRSACYGPSDYTNVNKLQAQLSLTPLAQWGKAYAPPINTSVSSSIDMKTPAPQQIAAMSAQTYFSRLAALMGKYGQPAADAPMVAELATLGLVPGKPFDITKADPIVATALKAAVQNGQKTILAARPSTIGARVANGWAISTGGGSYGTHYLRRAYFSLVGLGANLPEDAVYPLGKVDAAGKPMSGANDYVIHFAKGAIPPVNGFWSLTMYEGLGYFVPNPLKRYKVGSLSEPKLDVNPDGSVDLYISHVQPKTHANNWLPAPSGSFYMDFRLYWAKTAPPSVLDGTWNPPPVTQK